MNRKYKEQAEQLIEIYSLGNRNAIPTGSYYLDLMVCPDLDVYFESVSASNIFSMAEDFYCNENTVEVYVMKGQKIGLPEGEHIQIRTNVKTDCVAWKIDIWFFPQDVIAQKQADLDIFLNKLNAENRDNISRMKTSLIQATGFTPKYSSYHVYEAYLNQGLSELSQVKEYLLTKNIKFD